MVDADFQVQEIQDQLSSLFRKAGIILAFLFGSLSHKIAGPISDLDIGVLVPQTWTENQQFECRLKLLTEMQRNLGIDEIDLVLLNDLPPGIAFRIQDEGILIYCADEEKLASFKEETWRKYFDFKPVEEFFLSERLGWQNGARKKG